MDATAHPPSSGKGAVMQTSCRPPCTSTHDYEWAVTLKYGALLAVATSWQPPVARLLGHQGSIFRISWCASAGSLASVSDDRTLRIWKLPDLAACGSSTPVEVAPSQVQATGKNSIPCLIRQTTRANPSCSRLSPLAMGRTTSVNLDLHRLQVVRCQSSRLWDCLLLDGGRTAVTAGEDCSARVWDLCGKAAPPAPGKALPPGAADGATQTAKLLGHQGRALWRVAACDCLLVSGYCNSWRLWIRFAVEEALDRCLCSLPYQLRLSGPHIFHLCRRQAAPMAQSSFGSGTSGHDPLLRLSGTRS